MPEIGAFQDAVQGETSWATPTVTLHAVQTKNRDTPAQRDVFPLSHPDEWSPLPVSACRAVRKFEPSLQSVTAALFVLTKSLSGEPVLA